MQVIFARFLELLGTRFEKDAAIRTSEADICSALCLAAVSERAWRYSEVELEHQHPALAGNEKIDLVVRKLSIAVEFKYHRQNRGGTNQNRTKKAGEVLADVFRLARVPRHYASAKYLIYVTDEEMNAYFRSPHNHLDFLFDSSHSTSHCLDASVVAKLAKTARDVCGPIVCDSEVRRIASSVLPGGITAHLFAVS